MATQIPTQFLTFLPINSNSYPDAVVMALPQLEISFAQDDTWILDLTAKLSSMNPPLEHGIQSMYIDASSMPYGPCFISVVTTGSNQQITVLPNTQGFYPLIFPKAPSTPIVIYFANFNGKLRGSSVGINVSLLNTPNVAQVWSTNIPAPSSMTNTQLFNQTAGPLPVFTSFNTNGGTLLFMVSGTCYASVAGTSIGMNILVDGVVREVCSRAMNEINTHKALQTVFFTLSGIAAGSHTASLQLLNGSTTSDVDDRFNMTVIEYV